ncbi:MAG: zinc-binding alcohol dehydrogenase family protein [Chitinophaga sp.]|uniref:zinc-binding alcohol dehydrogenase family protein n=1 Tax=Chitinophaga sp. TaxID=1869181 RepID=UPI001B29CD4C|nr:zinc-binding alcohol dehydrogenase family protein [Chitinophaga sp.]MBO9727327.1 zinc-binding alcohol dehydrogenase family protein [Chitinophaga sp.]
MKTLICTIPGNFEYGLGAIPTLQPGHAIIKIKKVGICGTDFHAFEGTQPYFDYPRILGHELAGEIIALDDVPGFKEGDTVTVIPYENCGHCVACRAGKPNCCEHIAVFGVHKDGGMVDYLAVPGRLLVHGAGLTEEQLAMVEPLSIGAHGIRRAAVQQGEYVLIMGAGPIGLAAMEMARIAGATVIATDIREVRLQFVKNTLGIPHALLANGDVATQLRTITGGDLPTVVIDATGNQQAINNGIRYLAHGGRYVLIGLQKEMLMFSHPEFHKRETTLMSSRNATRADFEEVIRCIKQGLVSPEKYITHRIKFGDVKHVFPSLLDPRNEVIKAVVDM